MDFISQLCSVYWRVAHESCETLAISLEKKGLKKKVNSVGFHVRIPEKIHRKFGMKWSNSHHIYDNF